MTKKLEAIASLNQIPFYELIEQNDCDFRTFDASISPSWIIELLWLLKLCCVSYNFKYLNGEAIKWGTLSERWILDPEKA